MNPRVIIYCGNPREISVIFTDVTNEQRNEFYQAYSQVTRDSISGQPCVIKVDGKNEMYTRIETIVRILQVIGVSSQLRMARHKG